jgi:hypothetical protein
MKVNVEQILYEYTSGRSSIEIASSIGVRTQTVRDIIDGNVTKPKRAVRRGKRGYYKISAKDVDEFVKMARLGFNADEISWQTGKSITTVSKYLKGCGFANWSDGKDRFWVLTKTA